ncbi:MAG: 50S ribosomal protein L21e [Candidatus Aenigmatarchaeota archaeon]|nr:50S ribosomal protein L21e [Candidatus Aenigmarchaeota archaeon]
MVVKSHGPRRRTREKFRNPEKFKPNLFLQEFAEGTNVVIKTLSSSHSGMPFRRFHGKSGKVIGKRGNAYIVEIKDGNKIKKLIVNPEHLKKL